MKPTVSALALGLTAYVSLAACVSLTKSYPEKRSFVVEAERASTEQASTVSSAETLVLKVSRFRVAPLFAGRAMVYRTAELQYESDYYSEWFVAPGTLLTQQFTTWLSDAGPFQFVLMGTNHIEPTHLLEGTVTEFYGDFHQPGQPKAVFGIDLYLLDGKDERRVLLRHLYRHEVPLSDQSPGTLARGLTQALRLVLTDFHRQLTAGVVRTQPSNLTK